MDDGGVGKVVLVEITQFEFGQVFDSGCLGVGFGFFNPFGVEVKADAMSTREVWLRQ